jgi:hypothetical protein
LVQDKKEQNNMAGELPHTVEEMLTIMKKEHSKSVDFPFPEE